MSKLSDFYHLQPKFDAHANEEQQKVIKDMEISLIKEEVLPKLAKQAQAILEEVKRPLSIVLNYVPGEEVKVALNDDGEFITSAKEEEFVPEIVFTHKLDWSQFLYGMTIDTAFHKRVFEAVGVYIKRGKTIPITVLMDDMKFKCKFENADRKVKGDTIRLMYSGKVDNLGLYLQAKYSDAFLYLKELKTKYGGRKQFKLPDHLKRTITLKTTPTPMTFVMECK